MSSKRIELNKTYFFILSGIANPLGKELAVEMCRRFKAGSVAMLIDAEEEILSEISKELESLGKNIQVVCCNISDWQQADNNLFRHILENVHRHEVYGKTQFEIAFIVHNEGNTATHSLLEPEDIHSWSRHVQQNLYAAIALNQEFIKCPLLDSLPKLMVNISSSLWIQPLLFNTLLCSTKKARDMYFRSLVSEKDDKGLMALNYRPGVFDTHKAVCDCNGNIIAVKDVVSDSKILNLPRVQPLQSALKLINILEEISFISGHDVDYYDTYNL